MQSEIEKEKERKRDGRTEEKRVRLCETVGRCRIGQYTSGSTDYVSQSWETTGAGIGAQHNRTAPRPRHVRSLSLSRPARRLACLPARPPACLSVCRGCSLSLSLFLLYRADSRVSQLSLGSLESPVTHYASLDWRLESLNIKAKRKVDRSNFITWLSKLTL